MTWKKCVVEGISCFAGWQEVERGVALRDESEEYCHVQLMRHTRERIHPDFET